MQPTASEIATHEFYNWEVRGRGWDVYELPIQLEPPFFPFTHHYIPTYEHYVDDARKPWLLKRIANLIFPPKRGQKVDYQPTYEPPDLFLCNEPLTFFAVSVPKGQKVELPECEQLLVSLSYSTYPVSFEIIGSADTITLQFVCREPDAVHVYSQIQAYFPEVVLLQKEDGLDKAIDTQGYYATTDFGIEQEFMRPLASLDNLKTDPFVGLFAIFEQLQPDEHIAIQILFQGTVCPWQRSIMNSVTDNDGTAFFMDAPEMVKLAEEKIQYPLFAVAIRVLTVSKNGQRSLQLSDIAQKSLVRIYSSPYNSLIPLPNSDYTLDERAEDILYRQSRRQGMLLNSRELLSLVHLPTPLVVTSKLHTGARKTKAAPTITEGHTLTLGTNVHAEVTKEVSISESQRLKHTHIIGATGTGKSTLLESMIVQDITNGNGIAVLDPHGDLIESILGHIPEHRINDCIVIDPADTEFSVGFNILSAHSDIEKEILSSDLVASFKRLSTSWGDQMNSVLGNAILAFLESTEGGTLADLRRFLIEKTFRNQFLKTVTDPNIIYYWQKEYPLLKSSSIGSILTRLDTFLRPKPIRYMVAQKSTLDFEHILDTKKILLVKLSQGLIGNENSYLLGSFFVTKIYQAAMARQVKAKESRNNFYTYIDEFQNFITPSISQILSGARKYHLGLILAHQDMQQLVKHDAELASSITANAGTRICFRLGDTDAKRFASGMSYFEASDLENLNTGQAIARVERPDYDFSLATIPLHAPDTGYAKQVAQSVIDYSHGRYGTEKDDIEKMLSANIADMPVETIEDTKKPIQETKPKKPHTPIKEVTEEEIEVTKQKLVEQKEETEHRQLQNYIKKAVEARGYIARLEEPLEDSQERVDVSIEGNGKKIACEVCVTTNVEWELHNIEKCLKTGYELVVECTKNKNMLRGLKEKVSSHFDAKTQKKILISTPEDFIAYLDRQIIQEASKEKRIKGYRVKVEYNQVSQEELKHKKAVIGKTLLDAIKKNKK